MRVEVVWLSSEPNGQLLFVQYLASTVSGLIRIKSHNSQHYKSFSVVIFLLQFGFATDLITVTYSIDGLCWQ